MKRSGLVVAVLFMIACLPSYVFAQSGEGRAFEVSGMFGINGGLSDLAGLEALGGGTPVDPTLLDGLNDTDFSFGGGVAASLTEAVRVRFDVVRTGLFSIRADVPGTGEFVDVATDLTEFTGGIEYEWAGSSLSPFVTAGGGLARLGANVSTNISGTNLDVGVGDSGGTVNLGAGLRTLLSEHLGLRPQLQFVHISGDSFWRASVGVFYSFN